MAAQNSNNNENNTGINTNGIKNICSKYKKYIATGAMLVLLAVVISTSSKASQNKDPKQPGSVQDATKTDEENKDGAGQMEVNAYPQINALFEDYYKYYAAGDTESIAKIAFPIRKKAISSALANVWTAMKRLAAIPKAELRRASM